MITLLIGHRGVGKSRLLRRIAGFVPNVPCLDLDEVIAYRQRRSPADIFAQDGEEEFRRLEHETLRDLWPAL